MTGRRLSLAAGLAAACSIFALSVAPVAGQAKSAVPRDPNGRPDLQGIWSYATVTPLERPDALAGKATFASDDEVAEFEKTTVQNRNQDRRDGAGTNADVSRAYNDFWWDRGTKVLGRQTSLVVDPPDGRIPALTPQAQQRQAQRTEARRRSRPTPTTPRIEASGNAASRARCRCCPARTTTTSRSCRPRTT